jgi:hypothetical protein
MLSLQFLVINNFVGLCLFSHKDAPCRPMGDIVDGKKSQKFFQLLIFPPAF